MRKIGIAVALILVVVLVGWYEVFYRAENSHIAALKVKEQAAAASILSLQSQAQALEAGKKYLPKESAALRKLEQLMPSEPELDDLEVVLFAAAKKAGDKVVAIGSPSPGSWGQATPPVAGVAGPSELTLSLSVMGTPNHIEDLYRTLDTAPRLFVVDNFELGLGALGIKGLKTSNAVQSASFQVRAFYVDPNPSSAAS